MARPRRGSGYRISRGRCSSEAVRGPLPGDGASGSRLAPPCRHFPCTNLSGRGRLRFRPRPAWAFAPAGGQRRRARFHRGRIAPRRPSPRVSQQESPNGGRTCPGVPDVAVSSRLFLRPPNTRPRRDPGWGRRGSVPAHPMGTTASSFRHLGLASRHGPAAPVSGRRCGRSGRSPTSPGADVWCGRPLVLAVRVGGAAHRPASRRAASADRDRPRTRGPFDFGTARVAEPRGPALSVPVPPDCSISTSSLESAVGPGPAVIRRTRRPPRGPFARIVVADERARRPVAAVLVAVRPSRALGRLGGRAPDGGHHRPATAPTRSTDAGTRDALLRPTTSRDRATRFERSCDPER